MKLNAIGPYQFISLASVPRGAARQVEVTERPGVDGSGVVRTGRRGRPLQLASTVDVASQAVALELSLAYRELIGADPVELIWNNAFFTAAGYAFLVLDVEAQDCRQLAASVGGLNQGLGLLIAQWTLLPIPIP